MRRTINILTGLVFCAFLVLPLGLLAGLGSVEPYGQRDFTDFPDPKTLLQASGKARTALGNALFERSPATVFAIRTHNAALYHVVGTIDTESVVAGKRDWLFHKEQFWGGKCIPDDFFAATLRTIDTMEAMSAAAGLPMLFTVAPDKATIHPDQMGKRASVYAECKAQNGKRWRELATRYAPGLLDHTPAILDPRNPKAPYFFKTDTHWNSRSWAVATWQLIERLEGSAPGGPIPYAGVPYPRDTDIRNLILLLPDRELDENVSAFSEPRNSSKQILFISDSFYEVARSQLEMAYPAAKFYNFTTDEDAYVKALQDFSGQVVVNSVERLLFKKFPNWENPVGNAILERNMDRARSCSFTKPVDLATGATLANMQRAEGSNYQATTEDPNVVVAIPAKANCLRVELTVDKPTLFQLYLPTLQGRDDEEDFSEGRSVMLSLPAGKHVLNFLLPANRAGTALRIDPTNDSGPFALSEISFGNLP